MANDFSTIIPTLFAQALPVLRSNCTLPALVNSDYSTNAKEKGETISIPLASAVVTTDVVPGPYANDPGSVAPTTAKIVLNNWKEAAFTLTKRDAANAIDGIIPMELEAAVKALADSINGSLYSLYKQTYGHVGTAGVTPFATVADAANARKQLSIQLAPASDRVMILDPNAEAQALQLAAFSQYLQSGDKEVITEGHLGRKLGFNWFMDQVAPYHIAGSLGSGGAAVSAAAPVGAFTVSVTNSGSTGSLNLGDLISFAGDSQQYVVAFATPLAVGVDAVSISPALKVAKVGGEAVALVGSHTVNIAMHRDAIGFASRQLEDTRPGTSGNSMTMTDPVSKLSMTLEIREEHQRVRVSVSSLWGCALVRPELAIRVLG
jgi:hypothetical protein